MATTIRDIADELNLSLATVSRSLRQDPLIRPKTRARVTATALRLGYQPRVRPAKDPESKRSTIGFLMQFDSSVPISRYPNQMRMMEGVTGEAEANNIVITIHSVAQNERGKIGENPCNAPTMIRERTCDAVIVAGMHAPGDIAYLASIMPVISLSWLYDGTSVSAAVQENARPIRHLVEHLASLGHRHFAWVGAHHTSSFYEERQSGFLQGYCALNLPFDKLRLFGQEIYNEYTITDAQLILEAVQGGTTAFVCANDEKAMQVIQVLQEAGLRVPEDVSVTGYDAAGMVTSDGRLLTTVDPHFVEMGRSAVRLVMQRLANPTENPVFMVPQATILYGQTIGVVSETYGSCP